MNPHCRRVASLAAAMALSLFAAAVSAESTAATAAAFPQGLTLELHRVAEVSHSEHYRRRRLQNVDGKIEVVPLNPGLGTHYAWVYAGTPPQRASVITDTGSSLMAFPCSGCAGCGEHTDQPFAVSNSSTLTHVTCADANPFFSCKQCTDQSNMCSISQAYMEGSSWEATVVDDIVFLGGENSSSNEHMRDQFGTRFMFGCQSKETGLFISQVADGIMGLSNNDKNFVAKLYKERKIPNKLFSLCFADGGGSMSVGVPDTARHKGEIAYAKLGPDPLRTDFYNVNVKDIRVGNVTIDAPLNSYTHGHFIVDSGTTDSYLPTSMKKPFEAAFEKVTGLKYQASGSGCTGFTDEQLDTLPNIQVVLEAEDGTDLVLQVTPDQYLIQEKDKYCANIFLTEFSGGVIGANIMLYRDVIFDQGNKRVGFVDADCAYRNLETNDATPAPSTTPQDKPAPGVVASSETEKSMPSPSPAPATLAPTLAPTSAPTTAPSLTPSPTPELTQAPTQKPTLAPTPSPSSVETVELSTEKSGGAAPEPTKSLTTPAPTGSVKTSTTHTDHKNAEVDEHPMVLTVVGTILVAVFLLVVAASIKLKSKKKDHNWSRVKENEEDEDDEEELDPHTRSKKSHGKHQLRSDEVGSDDDDDDDDDDDEIFDRSAHDHEDTKHDTRMLERL